MPDIGLVGHNSAYESSNTIYVSPAIYSLINDSDETTRTQVMKDVKVYDLRQLINHFVEEETNYT
jgi:hypothetical protein